MKRYAAGRVNPREIKVLSVALHTRLVDGGGREGGRGGGEMEGEKKLPKAEKSNLK